MHIYSANINNRFVRKYSFMRNNFSLYLSKWNKPFFEPLYILLSFTLFFFFFCKCKYLHRLYILQMQRLGHKRKQNKIPIRKRKGRMFKRRRKNEVPGRRSKLTSNIYAILGYKKFVFTPNSFYRLKLFSSYIIFMNRN